MAKRGSSEEIERMYSGMNESRIKFIQELVRPFYPSPPFVFHSGVTQVRQCGEDILNPHFKVTTVVVIKIPCFPDCNHDVHLHCESELLDHDHESNPPLREIVFQEFGDSVQFWRSVIEASVDSLTFYRNTTTESFIVNEHFFSRLLQGCWSKGCETRLLKVLDLFVTYLVNFVDSWCDTRFLQLLFPHASIALELQSNRKANARRVVFFNFIEQRQSLKHAQNEIRRRMGLANPGAALILELDAAIDTRHQSRMQYAASVGLGDMVRAAESIAEPSLGAEFPDVVVLYLTNALFSFVVAVSEQFPALEAILTVVRPFSEQDKDGISLMAKYVAKNRRLRRLILTPQNGHSTMLDAGKLRLANELFHAFLAGRRSLNVFVQADYDALLPLGNAARLAELKDATVNQTAFHFFFASSLFERKTMGIIDRFVHGDTLLNNVMCKLQRRFDQISTLDLP
jgi:hypothetical protein